MYVLYIKPLADCILSTISLIILSPVFLLLALIIKVESKGPVLYIQKRPGKNNVHFNIYKFRSMKVGTPDVATHILGDPGQYLTRIGKLLRKTSLDELPQLVNILRGQMSLVGPRPALYNQYELIEARKGQGIDVLKPGLTGYAQIMGRDFITEEEKVAYDKYYLDNVSFLLDLKIIIHTFVKVVTGENVKFEKHW